MFGDYKQFEGMDPNSTVEAKHKIIHYKIICNNFNIYVLEILL